MTPRTIELAKILHEDRLRAAEHARRANRAAAHRARLRREQRLAARTALTGLLANLRRDRAAPKATEPVQEREPALD